MTVLAIDLGGSHIACGVVGGSRLLSADTLPTGESASLRDLLPQIENSLLSQCRSLQLDPTRVCGIGIGYPGIVDASTGEILSPLNKFDDVTGADLSEWAASTFHVPMRIENDARMALLGEHAAGAARGFEDVVMVTLGTGIGGAAMLQGRLLRSAMGQAGALGGHLIVNAGGRRCVCGAVGCAEAEASTAALPAVCCEWPGFAQSCLSHESRLDFASLFRCADAGDTVARAILSRSIEIWAALTVSLIHAYGPQLVLFGGGIMKRSDVILPAIHAHVDRHSWKTSRGIARIEAAALGEHAALYGAERLFTPEGM